MVTIRRVARYGAFMETSRDISAPATTWQGGGVFPVTQWSVVLRAARESRDGEAGRGLERLCTTYRPAVLALLRARMAEDGVEDVAQDFFLSVLRRQSLGNVTPERGRFRAWLRGCLKHHLAEHWRGRMTQKRGGGAAEVPLDVLGDAAGGVDWATPDRAFDQAWLQQIVAEALESLRAECDARGHAGRFDVLLPWLTGGGPEGSQESAAAELGMNTVALRSLLFRLRGRLRELLREAVAHTLDDPSQADDELRQLAAAGSF